MRIPSGVTNKYIYFVAVDSTDFTTRKTGLTAFTVYRSRNGGTATAMTTPTIIELSSSNMPGEYALLADEDMTIDSGDDTQEMIFSISATSMARVTRTIELFRPKITVGNTLDVTSTGGAGIDWSNVENPSTSVNLSGTTTNLVNTLTTYTGNTPQTGDSYARLGAPVNASHSADVAAVKTVADNIYSRLGAPSGASVSADILSVYGKVDTEVASIISTLGTAGAGLTAVASAANLAIVAGYIDTEIAAIKAKTDLIPASPSSLDAAGVRTALGMATANLDTQLADLPTVAEFEARTILSASYATPTNITAGTITNVGTVTNLTNAPTIGDFTATMKASITTAASASTPAVTVSDKTGFSISGTIQTLDALNIAQNIEHDSTQTQIGALNNISVSEILTTQMTESYAADGTAPTLPQALFLIQQMLGERLISGTTMTIKKIDGSTVAATFTLNDANNATGITRAS